jgi:hypothetical protein
MISLGEALAGIAWHYCKKYRTGGVTHHRSYEDGCHYHNLAFRFERTLGPRDICKAQEELSSLFAGVMCPEFNGALCPSVKIGFDINWLLVFKIRMPVGDDLYWDTKITVSDQFVNDLCAVFGKLGACN